MLFVLDDSIYTEPNVNAKLITLFTLGAASLRHLVLPQDPASPHFLHWVNSLNPPLNEDLSMLVDSSFRMASSQIFIKKPVVMASHLAQPQYAQGISIDSAIDLAQMPFRLYVENGRNDREFVLTFATPAQRERLEQLEKKNGFMFVHGGGITEMAAKIAAEVANNVAHPNYSWALFDGDSLMAGVPSAQSIALSKLCAQLGIRETQLQRRAIENYIPKNALRHWVFLGRKKKNRARDQRIRTYQAYLELTPKHAHHYNLKLGVVQDRKRADYPGDRIYAGIPLHVMAGLTNGFGTDVSSVYHNNGIAESDLRADQSWDELNNVVREIERHL